VKIIKETEFINLFQLRPTDPFWQTIEMMQCVVKSKTGCGSPIFVHFLAPVNTRIPDSVIDYSYDHFPSDQDLAHSEDDYHYALKQCFILA
jgi:hypothetical protein